MIGPFASACHRHRSELLDFADHRDVSAVDAASLEHLDQCRDCRLEVEATALAVVALRRLASDADRAVAPPDAWSRLRARIERKGAPWRWRGPVAALLASAGLVGILLAPAAYLRPPEPYLQEAGLEASIFDARRAAEDLIEVKVLQSQLAERTAPLPPDESAAAPLDVPVTWLGPDGLDLGRLSPVAPSSTVARHE